MSVEFEKVVLEKLKVLDKLSIKVDQLSKDMSESKEIVNNLFEKVDNNTALINNLTEKIDKLEVKFDIQGQNLASFENEFTVKV